MSDLPDEMIPTEARLIGGLEGYTPKPEDFSYGCHASYCYLCGDQATFVAQAEGDQLVCPECGLGRDLTRSEKDRALPEERRPDR